MMMVSNFVFEVVAFVVWHIYDTWRLWWFLPSILTAFDLLDPTGPLGRDGEADASR